MDGILLIDKPQGWTSFDVVNKVRRIIEQGGFNITGRKRFPVGHTGTLDPQATGLLVLLLGNYTKRAPELTKLDKTYEVTMRLGQTSTTGDEEGEKTTVSGKQPDEQAVEAALQQFTGGIMQTPPAYSAVKVNGQRAYKLARAGKAPQLEPRPVTIHRITLDSYEYPDVRFRAHVSSGTYIRTLVEDIGKRLGTGAYMPALRRTKVGSFDISEALTMGECTAAAIKNSLSGDS
jgi:tRNA pseudouridine55 synthase